MLRPVVRSLWRAPALTVAVVCTLALGMGSLITTFTVVDAALWRMPSFRGADRIVLLYGTRASARVAPQRERWSFSAITVLRELPPEIALLANYTTPLLTLTAVEDPESIPGEAVSPSYFPVLGAEPIVGRTFLESEDVVPGAHPVVVLGYELWQRRYGGDASVVGRHVSVNGVPLTVVGVMRPGFRGMSDRAQLWIPTVMSPRLNYPEYLTTHQHFISVVARLRPGVELSRLHSAVRLLRQRIEELPGERAEAGETVGAVAVPLNEARIGPHMRRSMLILFAAVGLLYLLACANAMNLLLGRALARRREAAVLAALGGTPLRVLRHFFAEGIVLVIAGSAAALLLAAWASTVVTPPAEMWGPRTFYGAVAAFAQPALDTRAVAFTAVLALLTVLLVAWAPAASAIRVELAAELKESGRGAAARAATLRRPSLRGAVVAVEAALAMLLLVGGGLMIASFARMRATDLGIDAERVLTFWVQPPEVRMPPPAAPAFVRRLLDSIERVPGVVAATVDGGAPVSGSARSTLFVVGRPQPRPDEAPPVLRHYVAPDHFRVLGVPVLRGRVFDERDVAGQPRVAIISESAARRFWPDRDPLGERVWFGGGSSFNHPDSSATIVGIVGDVVHEPLGVGRNRHDFYTPYAQFTYAARMVMVRTAGDPLAALPDIRRAVNAVDPDLPLIEVQPLTVLIGSSWSRTRFDAIVLGSFAAIALLLAAFGIYAVVAYAVRQRSRELGIRMAIGAQPSAIVRLVIREGMGWPALGLLAGLAASLVLTRFLQAALYEVAPVDAFVLVTTAALLLAVSLLACFAPARRATRQDVLIALRSD